MISKGNVSRETFLFDLWNWTNTCDTLQIMKKFTDPEKYQEPVHYFRRNENVLE